MNIEEIRDIMHRLQLDVDAKPQLIYVFYQTADGLINNLSISVQRARQRNRQPMSDQQLAQLLQQYPDARDAQLLAVEHPQRGLTRWMDSDEVCQRLHICRQTLRRWRQRGLLHPSAMGHRHYYDADEVDRLLQSNIIQENHRLDSTAL